MSRRSRLSVLLIMFAALAATAGPASARLDPGASITLGTRTQSSGCHLRSGGLPDPHCTPGAIFAKADLRMICVRGYTKRVRNVPAKVKRQVYASYGIRRHSRGQYEVDHLVPLEGGGSNSIANLFPQPANPRPGFHQKDKLENRMHSRVCSRRTPLRKAQLAIARNWLALYRDWF